MINFMSFSGHVAAINDLASQENHNAGCNKLMTVRDSSGSIVNFVVSPDTYFVDQEMIKTGDFIAAYYNGDAPAILIYPPQYPALIVVKYKQNQNVKVDFFNRQLVSSDGQLKLNLAPNTPVLLKNGQPFGGRPANRNLIVTYGSSTRSIPAQTTPSKIIVWCEQQQ